MPEANWTPLNSSSLSACRYDAQTQTLDVRFSNGKSYTLAGVPQSVAEGLTAAESPGAYFNANLRGQY